MDNLCIGTVQFGIDYGIANKAGKPSEENVLEIIKEASDNNIWFYDTAQAYGNSEEVLGKAFTTLRINNNVSVITKLHPDFEFSDHEMLQKTIQDSLDKLNVTQLWGLMLHRPTIKGNWKDFIHAVMDIKNRGLVTHFGASCYSPEEAIKFAQDPAIDILQIPFNVMDKRWLDINFFSIAEKNRKKIFIRSIYLQGLLFLNEEQLTEKKMEWSIPYLSHLKTFLNENSLECNSFAVNAIRMLLPNAIFVTGIDNKDQLRENIALFNSSLQNTNVLQTWWNSLPSFPEKLLNPSLWQ